jgi:hypothetical protein
MKTLEQLQAELAQAIKDCERYSRPRTRCAQLPV